ncbi:MAG: hypothetical protein GKR91_11360 [Pseudomonadales bacterium]|nr:hypothetical protein [Pseudomonadales bacterium]
MTTLIAFFLSFMFLAGLLLLVSPALVLDTIHAQARSKGIRIAAILVRLVLGIALILIAADTSYPTVITFFGALFLVAAIVIAVMPKDSFGDLLAWASSFPHWAARLAGAAVLVLLWFLVPILL